MQRDDLAKVIAEGSWHMTHSEHQITDAILEGLGFMLRHKLFSGPSAFRQAYAQLLIAELRTDAREIHINGPKAILARTASSSKMKTELKFSLLIQKWRAGMASNLLTQIRNLRFLRSGPLSINRQIRQGHFFKLTTVL